LVAINATTQKVRSKNKAKKKAKPDEIAENESQRVSISTGIYCISSLMPYGFGTIAFADTNF
jgi:hypothetical protein